jgi:hypothetical protein
VFFNNPRCPHPPKPSQTSQMTVSGTWRCRRMPAPLYQLWQCAPAWAGENLNSSRLGSSHVSPPLALTHSHLMRIEHFLHRIISWITTQPILSWYIIALWRAHLLSSSFWN